MRKQTIYQLLFQDLKQGKSIFYTLIIPLLFTLYLKVEATHLHNWLTNGTVIVFTLIMLIPYILIQFIVLSKLTYEKRVGYFKLLDMMPITSTEIITSKMLYGFITSVASALWFTALWCICIYNQSITILQNPWKILFIFSILIPLWICFYYAIFFKLGRSESWTANLLCIAIVFIIRQIYIRGRIDPLEHHFEAHTSIYLVGGFLCLLVSWIALNHRATKHYQKNLKEGSYENFNLERV